MRVNNAIRMPDGWYVFWFEKDPNNPSALIFKSIPEGLKPYWPHVREIVSTIAELGLCYFDGYSRLDVCVAAELYKALTGSKVVTGTELREIEKLQTTGDAK